MVFIHRLTTGDALSAGVDLAAGAALTVRFAAGAGVSDNAMPVKSSTATAASSMGTLHAGQPAAAGRPFGRIKLTISV
jgi:hypothetical protein